MKKKVILSVSNDLINDQRVNKVATSLTEFGFDVTSLGVKDKSRNIGERPYKTKYLNLFFQKHALFYAEYNIKLFFYLLFYDFDIYVSNDLDTLMPSYIASKIRGKKIVYDTHELFEALPELEGRPLVKKVWMIIEGWIFPNLKNIYTVNDIIANIYSEKYNVNVGVIRNIAPILENKIIDSGLSESKKGKKKMLILQGTGINMDRGAEELVLSMEFVGNAVLYIIGSGDVFSKLKQIVEEKSLYEKVVIVGRLPYNELLEYTKIADIGVSLDKGTNLNYEYSLPNKIFDFIQAEIPILASNRRVVAKLVKDNNIGHVIDTHEPKEIAEGIDYMLSNQERINTWKNNLKKASQVYNWENESKNLKDIYFNLK